MNFLKIKISPLLLSIYILHVLIAALLVFSGCDRHEDQAVDVYDRDSGARVDVPENVTNALRENANLQSQGLKSATIDVHKAYIYNDQNGYFDEANLGKEFQIIAVDVTFKNYAPGFDLDDIDLIDADTDDNFGSDPHLEGIVGDGALADIDDPDVWKTPKTVRVLLAYGPPKTTSRIKLSYWGDVITPNAIDLTGTGPQIAKSSIVSSVCWKEGPADDNYDRYLVVLTVQNWYRSKLPEYANLKCNSGINGDLDRFIEIDDDGKPIPRILKGRPYLLTKRRFLLDFWVPKDKIPSSFLYWGESLPLRFERIVIHEVTMTALQKAPVEKLTEHRLDDE